MVAIRLARTGAKKKPSYRVVVIDKRRARDSRNIEIVGHYNPRPDPIELVLKRDRIAYWLGVGAQPSDTVKRLLKYFDEHGASTVVAEESNGQPAEAEPETETKESQAPAAEEPQTLMPGPAEPAPADAPDEAEDEAEELSAELAGEADSQQDGAAEDVATEPEAAEGEQPAADEGSSQ